MIRNGVFLQAYNAQTLVSEDQVIVAHGVTNNGADNEQLVPMLERMLENAGELPSALTADNGYLSQETSPTARAPASTRTSRFERRMPNGRTSPQSPPRNARASRCR